MKRIANRCPVAFKKYSGMQMCQPKLMLGEDLFETAEDIDEAVTADVETLDLKKEASCLAQQGQELSNSSPTDSLHSDESGKV